MKKVVNEYILDYSVLKKFYQLNLQSKFYLVLLTLVLISTVSSFLENDIYFGIFSLVILILGCFYYFFLPLLLAKVTYRTFSNQSNGKDVYIKVIVSSNDIIIENENSKKRDVYSLHSVKKIKIGKDVFCLYTREKVPILFLQNGFVKGDKQQLYSLLKLEKK